MQRIVPLRDTKLKLFSTGQSDKLPPGEVFDRKAQDSLAVVAARPAPDNHWEILLGGNLTLNAKFSDGVRPVTFRKCFIFAPHWTGVGEVYQNSLEVDRRNAQQAFNSQSTELPTKIIWDVPYLDQLDNALNPSGSCNRTSIAMALKFFGIHGNGQGQFEDQMQRVLDQNQRSRHNPLHLKWLVEHYGAEDRFSFRTTKADLIKHLATIGPAVIHGYFTEYGHIITAVGYDDRGLWVHDPYGEWFASGYKLNSKANPQQGKLRHYSWGLIERTCMTEGQFWVHLISKPGFTTPPPLQVEYAKSTTTQIAQSSKANLSTVTALRQTLYKAEPIMSDRLSADEKLVMEQGVTIECVITRAANNHYQISLPNDQPIVADWDCAYVFADHISIITAGGTTGGQPGSKITEADIATIAHEIDVEPEVLQAVLIVEAAGSGFLPSGRPKILFEAHWFSDITEHIYDRSHPHISSPRWNRKLYKGGELEWDRLEEAMALNYDAAVDSASWGLPQIMGEHRTALGYGSAQNWVAAMSRSEAEQIRAMSKFIAQNQAMLRALQRKDWAKFAYLYNGEGYAANQYDIKMANAYEDLKS